MAEHGVIVQFFDFGKKFWAGDRRDLSALFELEDAIDAVLAASGAGELDGHEIAIDGSDGDLFLYGPDADALFAVIEPVLRASKVTQGGNATLRYGDADQPNVLEKYIEITPLPH